MGGSFFPWRPRPPRPPPGWGRCLARVRAGGDEAGTRGPVERQGRAALLAGRLDHAGSPHLLQPSGESQHRYRQRGLRSPQGAGKGLTWPRFRWGRARPAPVISGAGLAGGRGLQEGGACRRESPAAGGSWALLAAKRRRWDPLSAGLTAFPGRGR